MPLLLVETRDVLLVLSALSIALLPRLIKMTPRGGIDDLEHHLCASAATVSLMVLASWSIIGEFFHA